MQLSILCKDISHIVGHNIGATAHGLTLGCVLVLIQPLDCGDPGYMSQFPMLVQGDKQLVHAEGKGPWLIRKGHVSWNLRLELAGVRQEGWGRHARGCGEQPWPLPLRFSRRLALVGRDCRTELSASLQQVPASLGNVLPLLEDILPMAYQGL